MHRRRNVATTARRAARDQRTRLSALAPDVGVQSPPRPGIRPRSDLHPGADNQPLSCLLHRTATGLRGRIIDDLLPLNLTFPQYICLQSLAAEPDQSNADLARRVDVSPQAM